MRLLVVVDMQEDFIRGALTVPGAEEIISPIEKLVKEYIIADDAKIDDGEYLFDIADCITEITLVGVVTNLCVISCAVSFQQIFPDADIIIDASCCRSNNNELHNKALDVMEGLQMTIINRY